jgi:DNA recombination protein RmuC
VLAQVKTEFGKFGDIVESTRKSLELAARKFDEVGTRTRVINRRLKDVQSLPDAAVGPLSAGIPSLLSDVDSHDES